MNPQPNHIESRLSETMFRRYEPLWHTALSNLPNETQFDVPVGLAPTTFLARFRDTRISVLKFRYSTYLNIDLLLSTLNGTNQFVLSLSEDGKSVWFRARGQRGRPTQLKSSGLSVPTVPTLETNLRDMSPESLTALATLVHYGHLTGPFIIPGQVHPTIVTLQDTLNISFVYDEKTNQTILT